MKSTLIQTPEGRRSAGPLELTEIDEYGFRWRDLQAPTPEPAPARARRNHLKKILSTVEVR